jgi:hypothetical protein
LCEGPTCTLNGEGVLVIDELVSNVFGDPDGVGAFEFQVKFDHKIFDIVVEETDWLGHGGTRDVQCDFSIISENDIRFGCVSSDPTPGDGNNPPGQNENGVAARLTILPEGDLKYRLTPGQENGVVRTILDENCELADIFGDPLSDGTPAEICGDPPDPDCPYEALLPGILPGGLVAQCTDVTLTVRILEGDLNLDCVVDVIDDQMIAYRYGAFFGNLLYDPWYDLEPALKDFDVDIKDLQKVFGRNGSTCENQVPLQPPRAP